MTDRDDRSTWSREEWEAFLAVEARKEVRRLRSNRGRHDERWAHELSTKLVHEQPDASPAEIMKRVARLEQSEPDVLTFNGHDWRCYVEPRPGKKTDQLVCERQQQNGEVVRLQELAVDTFERRYLKTYCEFLQDHLSYRQQLIERKTSKS